MKILFVIDKLELKYFEFNKLVTNFWLIKGLLERNNEVCITTIPQLSLRQNRAYAKCYEAFGADNNIFYKEYRGSGCDPQDSVRAVLRGYVSCPGSQSLWAEELRSKSA